MMNAPYYTASCHMADHEERDGSIIPHWHCCRPGCPRPHRSESGALRCRWAEGASHHPKMGRPPKGDEPRDFVIMRLDKDDIRWLREHGVTRTVEKLVREARAGETA